MRPPEHPREPVTPPDGSRPVLVLSQRVPEHAQALSVMAVILGTAWTVRFGPLPASVTTFTSNPWVNYGWAAMFAVSGLPVLVAAWWPRKWIGPLRALRAEQGGHLIQAGACLYYAAGAGALGDRGWLGAGAFTAWAVAGIVRAMRIKIDLTAIRRTVMGGGQSG